MILLRCIRAEFIKLKRSPVPWVLGAVYCIAPAMMGLMMAALLNPDLASKMGLITAKAEMTIGTADWTTYLGLIAFLFAGGMIVLGIAEAYIFGREYAESTAKNMLTLPVGRLSIVAAKLIVAAVWFLAMAVLVYGIAIAVGFFIGLPGFDQAQLAANAKLVVKLVVQVLLVGSASALIAVVGRGYLAPVGFTILLLLVGDLFAHTGWGPWIPWSIIFITAGAAGAEGPVAGPWSMVVLAAFFLASAYAIYLTLERVDNTQ